ERVRLLLAQRGAVDVGDRRRVDPRRVAAARGQSDDEEERDDRTSEHARQHAVRRQSGRVPFDPMTIEVGQKAPAFTLANHAGEKVSLDKWKGRWVVLYFYPKDDTPGCTVEACEFTAALKQFQGLDA